MSQPEPTASVVLRPRAAGTLQCWLYDEIRSAILERRLPPGSKLPSRRALARQYRVSLTTVVSVSEKLVQLGYLDARAGSGTYVSAALPDRAAEGGVPQAAATRERRRSLSARGRILTAHPFPSSLAGESSAVFGLGSPLDVFPSETWNRLAGQRMRRERSLEALAHGEPLGFRPLRAALADHVGRTRGVRCRADQVVITCGTQHSLDLVARLLLDPGDEVWMEDPGYAPATSLLRAHGAKVVGVPVDSRGIDCAAGRLRSPHARLAYVTPSCQFPLGVQMSHERRLKLLQWANDAGAWVFEDDQDGQLQSDGRLQALHSLDRAGSVIYSNSLSGMLFPSLRLGFLILPPAFIEPAAAALSITQRYRSTAEQAVLTDFITQGHFDRQVRRMRDLYGERREALLAAGRVELRELLQFSDSQPGRQIVGWLAPGLSEAEVRRRAAARQIDSIELGTLTLDRPMPPGLVLGIGAADSRAIRTAIRRLGRILRVLAWQMRTRPARAKVPAQSTAQLPVDTRQPTVRRARPQPRNSSSLPARSPPALAPALSPRYR